MAVTIVRLLPKNRMRSYAIVAASIIGLFWAAMITQKIFFCGERWGNVPECNIPTYTAYMELAST